MTGSIECAACSGRNVYAVEQWPAGKRARALACRDCGLLFLHSSPVRGLPHGPNATDDSAEALWSLDDVSGTATKKGAALALMAAIDRDVALAGRAASLRVLGVGSGAEAWLNVFHDHKWQTFGIGAATAAKSTRHQLLADLPDDPRFDLVIAYRVLERVEHPLDALRALAGTIRLGGHCFVSVPRLDTLAIHRQTRSVLRPGKHVSAFTESCLRGLMARAGLQAVAALHDGDNAFTPAEPLVLRLLARRIDDPEPEPNPAAALEPVLRALQEFEAVGPQAAAVSVVPAPAVCPACGGTRVRSIDEWSLPGSGAHAAGCSDCGLLFVSPQPSQDALDAYYAPDGGWHSSRENRRIGAELSKTGAEGAIAIIVPALDRFFPATRPAAGARVFDFGCGTGAWLDSFQDRGWDTYGLEPSTDAAFPRHKRLLAVPSEPQFELVIAYHVLEHLPRPLEVLRELAAVLVPGGHLLVSVPRLDTLAVHRQVDYCLHPRHHIVGFTEACLRGLLARAGLEVVGSFHTLESARSKGLPVRLQLLARKAEATPVVESDADAALRSVIAAFVSVKAPARSSFAQPRVANH